MEQRTFERIPTDIRVRFHYNNTECSGNIKNLSEKGMFISTIETCIPLNFQYEILILLEEEMLNVPVNLNRITISPTSNGMGVELNNPTQDYLEFVGSLKTSL